MSLVIAERLAAWLRAIPNVVSVEVLHPETARVRIAVEYRVREPIGWRRVAWNFGRLDPGWMQAFKQRRMAERSDEG